MKDKPTSIIEYISWLMKKYHELQQQVQNRDAFRIVDIKQNKAGDCIFKIQLVGKAMTFESTPQEIAGNDRLLEGFSKKDVRTITYYATQEIRKPRYKIMVQEFREGLNRVIFKLRKRGSEEPIEKTAQEISLDKEILLKLEPEDAHLVGHTTATEQAAREKEEMVRLQLEAQQKIKKSDL